MRSKVTRLTSKNVIILSRQKYNFDIANYMTLEAENYIDKIKKSIVFLMGYL